MANRAESYAEHQFNDYERRELTEQDRIKYYIHSNEDIFMIEGVNTDYNIDSDEEKGSTK